jgi:hypothetical protein
MLINFLKILILSMAGIFLASCSSDTPDDEKYGGIEGNFPRLNDVPDRPTPPSQEVIERQEKDLEQDRLEAETLAAQNRQLARKK